MAFDAAPTEVAKPAEAGQSSSNNILHNPVLQSVLLRHPSISQDQHVLLQLLQTSKGLRTAVSALLVGQVPVRLQTSRLQHAVCFAQHWLPHHAGLLRSLDLELKSRHKNGIDGKWLQAVAAVAVAFARHQPALQSLALLGVPADAVLQSLPAQHLTRLCTFASGSPASMQSIASLTVLRSLDISSNELHCQHSDDISIIQPLTCLQQLTELHLAVTSTAQLQVLPPKLQRLGIAVNLQFDAQKLVHVAEWLQQHCRLICSLELVNGQCAKWAGEWDATWEAAMQALAAALAAAGDASAAAGAKEAGGAVMPAAGVACSSDSQGRLQLQRFAAKDATSVGPVLRHLPAASLTELHCTIDAGDPAVLEALCRLTALQSLSLTGCRDDAAGRRAWLSCQHDSLLAELSTLTRLECLSLEYVRTKQLQHLQLPSLQVLTVALAEAEQRERIILSHLSAVTRLENRERTSQSISTGDELPPHLRELEWWGSHGDSSTVVELLLQLSMLEKLNITLFDIPPAEELQLLTSLQHLTCIELEFLQASALDAATAAVLDVLPVKVLELRELADESLTVSTVPGGRASLPFTLLQYVSSLKGLKRLVVNGYGLGNAHLEATMHQVAALLKFMTALQELEVMHIGSIISSGSFDELLGGVSEMFDTLKELQQLKYFNVQLPVRFHAYEARNIICELLRSKCKTHSMMAEFEVLSGRVSWIGNRD